MAARKNNDVPGWLPFAIFGSGFVAVMAGIKSGWKLHQSQPAASTTPPVVQAGVVRGGLGAFS